MRQLFAFCHRNAWVVMVLTAMATVFAVWSAGQLRINVSSDELIPKNTEAWQNYLQVREQFGSDNLALVYVEDKNLFQRDTLIRLNDLVTELRGLPEVERIESLFSVSNITGQGGWVEVGPLFDRIPLDQAIIDRKKAQALDNPLFRRTVLSKNGDATLITLYLHQAEKSDHEFDRQVYQQIERIVENHQEDFGTLYQIGSPALHTWMSDFILADQKILLPAAGLLLVLLIGLLLGSAQAALIPVLNAAISTAWTLGLMALFGIPISMLNYIVPALILIIGSTEDVHILTEYQEARDQGMEGLEAVNFIASRIGLTLLLTGLTTSLGFAVTGLNALSIMQEFGAAAAIGMITRFLVSATFLPAYLRIFGCRLGHPPSDKAGHRKHRILAQRISHLVEVHLVPRAKWVIGGFALIALPCLLMIPNLKISNDLISFLHPDSPIIEKLDRVAGQLSGSKVIYVTLEGPPGIFKQTKGLKPVEELTLWLRQQSELDIVLSLSDYLSLVNQALMGEPEAFAVPTNDPLIAQYLLFFHRSDLQPYVSGDFAQANIVVRCNINDSTELNALVAQIDQYLKSHIPAGITYQISGKSVLIAAAVDKVVTGQVISLTTMVVTLFIVITVLFLSIRAGLMSVIANLFPVVVVFGLMVIAGVPLNVGTCMVAAITIGISVDDTLHLMVRYNKQLKVLKNETKAIAASIRDEFYPVVTTTLGLAGGFTVLGFSSFVPVMQFGFLSAVVMLLALITDLILTPVLLSTIRLITLWDLLGFKLRQALLENSPVFTGMTPWQAKKLILLANVEEHPAGAHYIRDGETGNQMYVIIEGESEVSKVVNGERVVLSRMGLGDIVGEIALVSATNRTADVHALTNVRVLALDWDSLLRLNRTSPFLSARLFLNLAGILGNRLGNALGKADSRAPFPPSAAASKDEQPPQ